MLQDGAKASIKLPSSTCTHPPRHSYPSWDGLLTPHDAHSKNLTDPDSQGDIDCTHPASDIQPQSKYKACMRACMQQHHQVALLSFTSLFNRFMDIHLPSQSYISLFPHGTCSLLVSNVDSALNNNYNPYLHTNPKEHNSQKAHHIVRNAVSTQDYHPYQC